MKEREKFSSRLGFILMSAGCAIGLGNVWRFPYITGVYGGGAFVLLYLFFLLILGLPIIVMEFAVGRGSQKSIAKSFNELEPKGSKWHIYRYFGIAGNYLLMMFYTTVAGWMLYYFYGFLTGKFTGQTQEGVTALFGEMLASPGTNTFWMVLVVILGIMVCSMGLQAGVERITKGMMIGLLSLMIVLAVHGLFLDGGAAGLRFYLLPAFEKFQEVGVGKVIVAAMNQSFFTLSLGIGAMAIFGSYIGKDRSLLGESVTIAALDTFVAITSGLIIFPACFTFGVDQTQGPSLVFITLPNIFNNIPFGRVWGSLFFVFMTFAAFSTVLAVFENIVSCCMELTGFNRKKSSIVNMILVALLSMPCVLGFNLWSFDWLGVFGGSFLDFEDFLVSNIWLPLGSLIYLLFCTSKFGWGWKNYKEEANTGKGIKIHNWMRVYLTYILPLIVLFIFAFGIYDKFWAK